jgi:hypothetical protein
MSLDFLLDSNEMHPSRLTVRRYLPCTSKLLPHPDLLEAVAQLVRAPNS